MTTKQLSIPSGFFFIFNGIASGFLYTWLKFDVLGHSTGTGVVPGPWLVVPFLSVGVLGISAAVASVLYLLLKSMNKSKTTSFINILLISFIGCSVLFHLWYALTTVLNSNA